MNEENTRYLLDNFPYLYTVLSSFECGDGWFDIIKELSEQLEPLIKQSRIEIEDEEILYSYCVQVKEKRGTLRFYMNTETDRMSTYIQIAEDKTSRICEICGKNGKLYRRDKYFMSTCCEEHKE